MFPFIPFCWFTATCTPITSAFIATFQFIINARRLNLSICLRASRQKKFPFVFDHFAKCFPSGLGLWWRSATATGKDCCETWQIPINLHERKIYLFMIKSQWSIQSLKCLRRNTVDGFSSFLGVFTSRARSENCRNFVEKLPANEILSRKWKTCVCDVDSDETK